MPPPSVSVESKKQKERDRGRKRRQQLRRQGQARQLREVDSHETIRLVSQVHDVEDEVTSRELDLPIQDISSYYQTHGPASC